MQRAGRSSGTWGNNVIVIRNKVSGDIITAQRSVSKPSRINANAKAGNTMPWVFDCGKIGGFSEVLTDGMLNQRPRLPRGIKTQRF